MVSAKEWTDKYNSFNSLKALVHCDYWRQIVTAGTIPPPVFISVDPFGGCNLHCSYCNAAEAIAVNKAQMLSLDQISSLVKLLTIWKTRAVCIAGGGEPLLNPHTPYLVRALQSAGIRAGLITNGVRLDRNPEAYLDCVWVGCSVDAGSPDTYAKLKGTLPDTYQLVLNNLQDLAARTRLRSNPRSCEVTYKYLIHPENYFDIYNAVKNAKAVGCDTFHARPGGDPWFALEGHEFAFTPTMVEEANRQLDEARKEFEDRSFKVFGVVHKFTDDWKIKHSFSRCHAASVNCHITPSGRIDLCCDRRGDPSLSLCTVEEELAIREGRSQEPIGWGSERHHQLINAINIKECPRCTYSHVNEIFDHVLLKDSMLCDFI